VDGCAPPFSSLLRARTRYPLDAARADNGVSPWLGPVRLWKISEGEAGRSAQAHAANPGATLAGTTILCSLHPTSMAQWAELLLPSWSYFSKHGTRWTFHRSVAHASPPVLWWKTAIPMTQALRCQSTRHGCIFRRAVYGDRPPMAKHRVRWATQKPEGARMVCEVRNQDLC
jgi:hypothetical protein